MLSLPPCPFKLCFIFILTLALLTDNMTIFAFNNLHNIIVTNFKINESLQITKLQSSAILKHTQRRMMLIRQSALLISGVKSGSLSHKTKPIKTEEFEHKLKVIFFFPPAVKSFSRKVASIIQCILDLFQEELWATAEGHTGINKYMKEFAPGVQLEINSVKWPNI